MLLQVESSENGSRTVVKGSTALPPCSGRFLCFFSFIGSVSSFILFSGGFICFFFFWSCMYNFSLPTLNAMGSPRQNNNNITISAAEVILSIFNLYISSVTKSALDLCLDNSLEKKVRLPPKLSLPIKLCKNVVAAHRVVVKKTIMLR